MLKVAYEMKVFRHLVVQTFYEYTVCPVLSENTRVPWTLWMMEMKTFERNVVGFRGGHALPIFVLSCNDFENPYEAQKKGLYI